MKSIALFVALTLSPFISAETYVYFGTYAQNASKGIYRSTLDMKTGQLSTPILAAEALDPEFLVINNSGDRLYAIRRFKEESGSLAAGVSAYSIDAKGNLSLLNEQLSAHGRSCHVALDKTNRVLLTANYGNGVVESYPIRNDGSIAPTASSIQHEGSSINPQRQKGPHAHSTNTDPNNRWAYSADLGIDQIRIYKLDIETGSISPNSVPFAKTQAGGGPRHMDFHPKMDVAYTNLELTSKVSAFKLDPQTGGLTEIQTLSTLPADADPSKNSTAETLVHPSGRFLYVSNRGHDSIAIFAIDPQSGKLTFKGTESTRGSTPRNFGIDPSGKFLIASNQSSGDIYVFRIDADSGLLEWTGSKVEIDDCICVRFLER